MAGRTLTTTTTTTTSKPCLRYLHAFNDVGGRPDERLGSRGSFTPGVRIMSGGQRPHEQEQMPPPETADDTHRGKVLFVSKTLKPNLSDEARTNVVGGRPTERLGTRGSFTPGSKKRFLGGTPRDMPLGTETINPGTVLFVSSTHKPDLSGVPSTNVVGGRPTERWGSRGSFTPGARVMSGGPRSDAPAKASSNHAGNAVVLRVSTTLKPDLSGEARYNTVGGRPTERLGSRGSFTPGARATWLGGAPRDVPLEATVNPGKMLFVSSVHKPDLSGEARTNMARPDERMGTRGSFTPGARGWLGGEPRDVPAEREVEDHGTVLFPMPLPCDDDDWSCCEDDGEEEDEEEDELSAVPVNHAAAAVAVMVDTGGRAAMVKENSGVFLRSCGSDTHLSALSSESHRPAF
ncbi:unnamed protein product [Laminaria digitata]